MATAVATPARVRWGDVDDEEDALPPPSTTGPDARGIKTATEFRRNERGEMVKVTTRTRVSKVERKVYKVRVREFIFRSTCPGKGKRRARRRGASQTHESPRAHTPHHHA